MMIFQRISFLCILWTVVKSQDCGGYYYGQNGEFESPGFPDSYGKLEDCEYIIDAGGEMTELSIDFDVEEGGYYCEYDYIEVYDEYRSLLDTFCKYGSRVFFGMYFRIKFHSDFSVVRGGFIAHWRKVCGGNFWNANGNLTTPHFPWSYDNDMYCEWYIDAWTPIKMEISYEIEAGSYDCPFDRIDVYNGNFRKIDTLCGAGNVTYFGYAFFLIFSTDGSMTCPGFKATWREYDGEFTTLPTTTWTNSRWWTTKSTPNWWSTESTPTWWTTESTQNWWNSTTTPSWWNSTISTWWNITDSITP